MIKRIFIKTAIVLSVICLPPSLNSFAQTQTNNQAAQKFDEFGDIYLTDIKARLDNFAIQLQQQPNTRGFIIVYRSRRDLPGLSSRLAARMRGYLIQLRGFSTERVVTVDGGVASCVWQELWIVPIGATPTPRPDAYSNQLIDTTSVRKFDDYYYPLDGDVNVYDDYFGDSLEAFAEALRKEPRAQGYIIAYPQYYIEHWEEDIEERATKTHSKVHLDSPNTALKMLKAVKADLVNKYRIASSRVRTVNGGYRKSRSVELWIVPRGEHPPIATPNAFPKRRR